MVTEVMLGVFVQRSEFACVFPHSVCKRASADWPPGSPEHTGTQTLVSNSIAGQCARAAGRND